MKKKLRRLVYRAIRRFRKRIVSIHSNLSNHYTNRVNISSTNNHFSDCFVKDELFSIATNSIDYQGNKPYWLNFYKIKLKPIGVYHDRTEVISKGILINSQNEVILDSTIGQKEYLNKLNSNHLVHFNWILPSKSIDKAIVLSNYLETNYYHWLLESIGRIAIVPKEKLCEYNIVVHKNTKPFIKESLVVLFNVKPKNIIYKKTFSKLKIKDTLIPTFPFTRNKLTNETNIYSPKVIKKVNEIALTKAIKGIKKNFIISRNKATQRRIINQEIILKHFPNLDFEIVYLENLSFKNQMNLFANANVIIATHGAGLANLLFSDNPLVIEFFPENRYNRDAFYFYQISQALNFKHHIIEYKSINNSQDLELNQDILKKLKVILDKNS